MDVFMVTSNNFSQISASKILLSFPSSLFVNGNKHRDVLNAVAVISTIQITPIRKHTARPLDLAF